MHETNKTHTTALPWLGSHMKKTRSQRTLIGRNKNAFYWLIGERTKLQRRTQLQRYICTPQPRPQGPLAFRYGGDRKGRRPWGRGCVKIEMAAIKK